MECLYDTLFEIPCGAIGELASVPCAYRQGAEFMTRQKWGAFVWMSTYMGPKFRKRLTWLAECGSFHTGRFWILDYLKGNSTKYFLRVESIWGPVKYKWGWTIDNITLSSPTCYYLGTFPNYWNTDNHKIVQAHDLMTPNTWIMGMTPYLPGVSSPESYKDNREDMDFFIGKKLTDAWFEQKAALKQRADFFQACLDAHYPKRPKKPPPKLWGPPPGYDYPGEPVKPPPPDRPSSGRARPPDINLKTTIALGIKAGVPYNALELTLTFEEVG